MRRLISLVALTLCIECFSFGQTVKENFHWDRHNVQRDGWDRIAQANFLSANERALLVAAVTGQLRPHMSAMGIESEEGLRKTAGQAYVKVVDLGDDGGRQFLARGTGEYLCSPTGNCEAWIFRLHDSMCLLILHRPATQAFTIQPTKTNGFHDLVLGQHGSATDQDLTLYRFDGSKYKRVACYDARWDFLGKDDELHTRKEPLLTSEICAFR